MGVDVVYDTVSVLFEVAFGHLGRLRSGRLDKVLGNLVYSPRSARSGDKPRLIRRFLPGSLWLASLSLGLVGTEKI